MIFITGGSGFIGSHFHRVLKNENVINLDISPPAFRHSATFIQGDIRNFGDVKKALQNNTVRTIVSLAAKHHDFGIGHDEYFDTNEGGTEVICQAATEFGINEIIFYSSVAVYGVQPRVSSESTSPQPDSPYGASKLAGERVLHQWAGADPNRKVLIIRPTIVFGENNRANMYNLIRQIDSGFYFHLGKADNIKSIAFVDNLVDATLFLKDQMVSGVSVYNYADEPQLFTREIADEIAGALGKKVSITLPLSIALGLAAPFDLAIKLTGKNLPISSARVKKLATQTHHSAVKLFNEGFHPRFTTRQGIVKMVEWYRSLDVK